MNILIERLKLLLLLSTTLLLESGCASILVADKYARTQISYKFDGNIFIDQSTNYIAFTGLRFENELATNSQYYFTYRQNGRYLTFIESLKEKPDLKFTILSDVPSIDDSKVKTMNKIELTNLYNSIKRDDLSIDPIRIFKNNSDIYYLTINENNEYNLVKVWNPNNKWNNNYVKWYRYPDFTMVMTAAVVVDIVLSPIIIFYSIYPPVIR
jgi:hypothetical protein